MMTLIAAAALAAQPAPTTNAQAPEAPAKVAQHQQHDGMKKDCCKDCCKDMAAKHEGHGDNHGGHDAR